MSSLITRLKIKPFFCIFSRLEAAPTKNIIEPVWLWERLPAARIQLCRVSFVRLSKC